MGNKSHALKITTVVIPGTIKINDWGVMIRVIIGCYTEYLLSSKLNF